MRRIPITENPFDLLMIVKFDCHKYEPYGWQIKVNDPIWEFTWIGFSIYLMVIPILENIMQALRKHIDEVLFIDIETASLCPQYDQLDPIMQQHWLHKAKLLLKSQEISQEIAGDLYSSKGAIYSEFSKIVCISIGYLLKKKNEVVSMRTKSFYAGSEQDILNDFIQIMNRHFDKPKKQYLSGHNIREFDIPFICRRLVINKIKIPKKLDISGKKPWDLDYLVDTLNLWKFGDYKSYTSLSLLSHVLGIPSPKDDIDGSMVHQVYWEDSNIERIAKYCEKDVVTSAKVLMRLLNIEPSEDFNNISKSNLTETDEVI